MRMREIWLLLLLAAMAFAWRDDVIESVDNAIPLAAAARLPAQGEWVYDVHAPYYSFLPADVQAFHSEAPDETASVVCEALGGRLDFLQPIDPFRPSLGFNCRFHEPDLTISAEFGDLRRMPTRL